MSVLDSSSNLHELHRHTSTSSALKEIHVVETRNAVHLSGHLHTLSAVLYWVSTVFAAAFRSELVLQAASLVALAVLEFKAFLTGETLFAVVIAVRAAFEGSLAEVALLGEFVIESA